MPEGFLQCKFNLPYKASKFLFTCKNQITQRVWPWRRPSANPHLLLHSLQQRQRSNVFFNWAQRGQLAYEGTAFPLLLPVFPVWWEKLHLNWATTVFKWLFLPIFSQIHEKEICRKHDLMAEDWSLHDPTLVSNWTLEGLHLQSLLNVTWLLYLPASVQLQTHVLKFSSIKKPD